MKYKVGDEVTIRKDLNSDMGNVVKGMIEYKGKKLKNIADSTKIFITDCMLDYIDENDLDGADIQLVEHFARYIRNNIK